MSQSEQDHPRYEWLDQAKRLCKLLVRRDAFFDEACPKYGLSSEEEEEALAKVAKASKEVEEICGRLVQMESESKVPIGARALLGDTPIPQHLVSAIALLAISRLSSDAAREFSQVSSLTDYCAGRDARTALAIRDAFGIAGQLRPFVTVRLTPVIDRHDVELTESAFAAVLGREPSQEALILGESVTHSGKWLR